MRVCGREGERGKGRWGGVGSKSESGRERESKYEESRETVAVRTRRRRSGWDREKMRETDGHRLQDPVGLEPLTTVLTS